MMSVFPAGLSSTRSSASEFRTNGRRGQPSPCKGRENSYDCTPGRADAINGFDLCSKIPAFLRQPLPLSSLPVFQTLESGEIDLERARIIAKPFPLSTGSRLPPSRFGKRLGPKRKAQPELSGH
jgi:hypothetical protein